MSVELLLTQGGSILSNSNGGTNTQFGSQNPSPTSTFVVGNLNTSILDLDGLIPATNYRDNSPPGAQSF
jgi:hypothetical protein